MLDRIANETPAGKRSSALMQLLMSKAELPVFLFILVFIAFLSLSTDHFFTMNNFENITRQIAVIGVLSIAMSLSIISSGLDLSVGSVLGLTVSVVGTFIQLGWPLPAVFLVSLAVGAACGFINGAIIVKLSINPIIVTLGTMEIFKGIAFVYTGGAWKTGLPPEFLALGKGYIPIILLLAVTVLFALLMRMSRFGRHVYAVGGSEQSAKFAGVHVNRTKLILFTLCGALTGFAAMIFIGRTGVIQPSAGTGYEMQAIAAAILGGVVITGGRGTVIGTLLGVILSGLFLNGMTLLKISAYWQGTVVGTAIIIALMFDTARNAYARRRAI